MSVKTIVLYHFFDGNDTYRENLSFFLEFGVHPDVDYLVLISGGCSIPLPMIDNVRYVHTPNRGFDFGAYAVGLHHIDVNNYFHFIFVNCTVRGPLLIHNRAHWTTLFTDLLSRDVKLVGTTINILPGGNINADAYQRFSGRVPPFPHVQSMVFAMDRACLALLRRHGFFAAVPEGKTDVIAQFEIHLSQLVLAHGWNIACLAPDYRDIDFRTVTADVNPTSANGDPWFAGAYFGRSLHPYETVFFKNNRGIRPAEEIDGLSRSQRARPRPRPIQPPLERALAAIPTSWAGHRLFALWLAGRADAGVVVDVGGDYSALCFASAGTGEVFGIGDTGGRDGSGPSEACRRLSGIKAELGLSRLHIVDGALGDVALTWTRTVDVLHVAPSRGFGLDRDTFASWRSLVRRGGVVLVHGTCVPDAGARSLFDDVGGPRLNFAHAGGLGVLSSDPGLIAEIAEVFSTLIEPGSLRV